MVKVWQFTFNPFQENTYLLAAENGDCAIVDPGCYNQNEWKTLNRAIEENGLKPTLLLNTHCHIDHVFGNYLVQDKYGLSPMISKNEKPVFDTVSQVAGMYGLNYTPSKDPIFYEENFIKLGNVEFEILEVPGHSPGHVAFYQNESKLLISGDVLFKRSIGRTDLPGGDFNTLIKSIESEIFKLPDETRVLAGHMEETTVGEEKRFNPFLTGAYQG